MARPKPYIVSSEWPILTPYQTARQLGCTPTEAIKLVRWAKETVEASMADGGILVTYIGPPV